MKKIIFVVFVLLFVVQDVQGRIFWSRGDPYSEESQIILKAAHLGKIETFHCGKLRYRPSNTTLAFGCFMAKTARMFESPPVTDLLAALGEPAIHVQADILEKRNPNSLCTKLAMMPNRKWVGEFPNLPFNSYDFNADRHLSGRSFSATPVGHFMKIELLRRIRNNFIPLGRLQDDLYALDGRLVEMMSLLEGARNDTTFRFIIPKGSCPVSRNIQIRNVDVQGFYGMLGSLRIVVNLLHAYTIGLDPARFMDASGGMMHRGEQRIQFVNDANGVDGDRRKFAELISGRGDLSTLRNLMLESMNSLIQTIDSVRGSSNSDVFGHLLRMKYRQFFTHVNHAAKDLKYSLEHSGLTPMSNLGHSNIRIDVGRFLSNLPDPAVVEDSDPFVIVVGGRVRAVAEFFRELLAGIAEF